MFEEAILVILISAIFTIGLLYIFLNKAKALPNANLSQIEGIMKLGWHNRGKHSFQAYYVLADNKTVIFRDNRSYPFEEDKFYRIFYCKHGYGVSENVIISFEKK
ncbi:MAG: hypothetical protein WBP45_05105 [Daejeonella sp.]